VKSKLILFLFILLVIDAAYSFYQHYQVHLDGDMPANIVPAPACVLVLQDPFGYNALVHHQKYVGPNRFWAHFTQSVYFKKVPILLQSWVKPIDSVYLSCAIAKTLLQLFLIWLLAVFISGVKNIFRKEFIIGAILVTPLFQTFGYNTLMGIIDISTTYTFFYALPIALTMLFLLPFYRAWLNNFEFRLNIISKILLLFLIVVISFNGPLVPGVILIICPWILLNLWYKNYQVIKSNSFINSFFKAISGIPGYLIVYFSIVIVASLYSLYIGTFNSDQTQWNVPILERYTRIPNGIFDLLSLRIGFPLLLAFIGVNYYFLKKRIHDFEAIRILRLIKWVGLFSLIYILLLPLGGYREYRHDIVRRDTIIPITLALIFIYGLSSYYLLSVFQKRTRNIYVAGLTVFLLIFTIADGPETHSNNVCERQALEKIAKSRNNIVAIDSCDCSVVSWVKITDFNDSEYNAEMLRIWGITQEKKLYFQK
jgi:hypothetical protein